MSNANNLEMTTLLPWTQKEQFIYPQNLIVLDITLYPVGNLEKSDLAHE